MSATAQSAAAAADPVLDLLSSPAQAAAEPSKPAAAPVTAPRSVASENAQLAENDFRSVSSTPWEYAGLFDQLASSMVRDSYDWALLLDIACVLLGEKDRAAAASSSNEEQEGNERSDVDANASLADEAADGEDAEPQAAAEVPAINISEPATAADSSSAINAADLGAHQLRAFKYLMVAIVRHLAPDESAQRPASATPTAHAAPTACPPVIVPRNGDVVGVWLVSLLCASRNRSVGLSFLRAIEVLAGVATLRLTTQKLFQLLQRERREENGVVGPGDVVTPRASSDDAAHGVLARSGASALSSSELARIVPSQLSSSHLSPSTLLPLPPLSSRSIYHLQLRTAVLKTLQCIIGDDVTLPSVSPLSGSPDVAARERDLYPSVPGPDSWYEFTDTPIFPRVSGGASPAGTGYCWSAWISLSSLPDAQAVAAPGAAPQPGSGNQHNVLRFFNDVGHGVQVYIKQNTLCARLLPHAIDATPLKNFVLHAHRWHHLVLVHKPLTPPSKQQAALPHTPPVTSNMANSLRLQKASAHRLASPPRRIGPPWAQRRTDTRPPRRARCATCRRWRSWLLLVRA